MIFMVDDWSLKNKEEHCEGSWFGYSDHDIDTLRQKLIKDFEFIFCNQESEFRNFTYRNIILTIINKRFGVE